MRARIEKEKGTRDPWELKQVRGGLVDLEFIAQHLQLVHAADHPTVLSQNTMAALQNLGSARLLPAAAAEALLPASRLLNNLTQVLRLCLDGPFEPAKAPTASRPCWRGPARSRISSGWRPIWRPGRPRWRAFSTPWWFEAPADGNPPEPPFPGHMEQADIPRSHPLERQEQCPGRSY